MAEPKGTPQSLAQAIVNGLVDARTVLMSEGEAKALAKEVLPHVKDYLNQRLGIPMMSDNAEVVKAIKELIKKI
jgi:hypothetical protein